MDGSALIQIKIVNSALMSALAGRNSVGSSVVQSSVQPSSGYEVQSLPLLRKRLNVSGVTPKYDAM